MNPDLFNFADPAFKITLLHVGRVVMRMEVQMVVVLESSHDQDHAVGNVEGLGADASGEAVGKDSNVTMLLPT
jgi:hypothetical protein